MFGYIKPYKPELKIKELSKYSNFYCALCDQLKRDYGFFSRFILNYDITFLLIWLNLIDADEKVYRKIRCPYNPLRVRSVELSESAIHYAAFINCWLVTEKLLDDYHDDKNPLKSVLRKHLISKKGFQKSIKRYEAKTGTLSSLLTDVYQAEASVADSFDFDRVTNLFGRFFAELFFPDHHIDREDVFKKLFFQIGKWIYIIDAFDDYQTDKKKHRLNLLQSLLENDETDQEMVFEKALSIHYQLKQKIMNLLQDLDGDLGDACLNNVLTFGLDHVFYRITEKKYKACLGRLTQNES